MVDSVYLRELAMASLRIRQMADDRGFVSPLRLSRIHEEHLSQRAIEIWTRAFAEKKSLSEICSETFAFKKDSDVTLWVTFLDRN
jgi:hypothetical protein